MEFTNTDMVLLEEDVQRVEAEIELSFPPSLRCHFLTNNGGEPEPYVFENGVLQISTVVSETLPLLTANERGTAVAAYQNQIIGKALAPRTFFPFAVDGGGDYFLVNCDSGAVYFMKSDRYPDIELVDLHLDLEGFWESLQDE